jgi:hypothetical protein
METGFKEPGWTIAVPMVVATAVVKINGPSMLHRDVRSTARHGDRDRVATTVAIECAASLAPLTKFRESARITPKMIRGSMISGMVQDDVIDCVPDIIAFLHYQAESFVNILEFDDQKQVL